MSIIQPKIITNWSNIYSFYDWTWKYCVLYHYTIIQLTLRYESIIIFYSYLSQIQKTSSPNSYSSHISSVFLFDNIRIRIHFENMKTNMKMALSGPHTIRFHPRSHWQVIKFFFLFEIFVDLHSIRSMTRLPVPSQSQSVTLSNGSHPSTYQQLASGHQSIRRRAALKDGSETASCLQMHQRCTAGRGAHQDED
jgi:hypothetical protein